MRQPAQSSPDRKTQEDQLLVLFLSHPNQWIGLPIILDMKISQYSARILGLRRKGWNIENRCERKGRARHSWFRLVLPGISSAMLAPTKEPDPSPDPAADEDPLLFDPAPYKKQVHRDDG
jgi:hypothetical protein